MTLIHKPRHSGFVQDYWMDLEETPRRVRVVFGGETVADSRHVLLVREAMHTPSYYFPKEDVRTDHMVSSGHKAKDPHKGDASYWNLKVGDKAAENGVWSYPDPSQECAGIKGYIAFEWNKMDALYEEEERIYVHPRDPYKRVDALQSSRHVRVVVAGETVGESSRPRVLFETGHPLRYYLPKEDVRMDLLEPSPTTSRCPYKGLASYWSVKTGGNVYKDFVWSYPEPVPECPRIKDLFCFFNERVEAIHVDGEQVGIPKTRWSLT